MQKSRRKFIKSGLFIGTSLILLDAFWLEKFFIGTNEFFMGASTESTTNIKVIQISDLHLQSINYQITRLAKKINGLLPDLVVITGDAIDKFQNLPLLDRFLKLINHDIRKVAILGNWEYWGKINIPELEKLYRIHNCKLLINQSAKYMLQGKSVLISGIDDYLGGNADYEKAMEDGQTCDYHIVLNHCPEYNDHISEKMPRNVSTDLILSGHTHGGQINILGYIPFLPDGSGRYIKGWYEYKNLKAYVSKGIGTSILPIRFGARSEIAVFNFPA